MLAVIMIKSWPGIRGLGRMKLVRGRHHQSIYRFRNIETRTTGGYGRVSLVCSSKVALQIMRPDIFKK